MKRELLTFAQYFVLVIVAGLLAFMLFTFPPSTSGEYADAINFGEAWRIYEPVMFDWLKIFGGLGVIRLAVLFVMRKQGKHL
ncbi:MAG: hypothetical protein M3371_02320 [Acidobacteriota bacterium]|nr:hypothetical protein [Acidobacteriota bacterium]